MRDSRSAPRSVQLLEGPQASAYLQRCMLPDQRGLVGHAQNIQAVKVIVLAL